METSEIQGILQTVHEIEQKEGRMIGRKELHKHLPTALTYQDKGKLIHSWQRTYFDRLRHVGIFRR